VESLSVKRVCHDGQVASNSFSIPIKRLHLSAVQGKRHRLTKFTDFDWRPLRGKSPIQFVVDRPAAQHYHIAKSGWVVALIASLGEAANANIKKSKIHEKYIEEATNITDIYE
jgi:hypothetical protein